MFESLLFDFQAMLERLRDDYVRATMRLLPDEVDALNNQLAAHADVLFLATHKVDGSPGFILANGKFGAEGPSRIAVIWCGTDDEFSRCIDDFGAPSLQALRREVATDIANNGQ